MNWKVIVMSENESVVVSGPELHPLVGPRHGKQKPRGLGRELEAGFPWPHGGYFEVQTQTWSSSDFVRQNSKDNWTWV